MRTGCQWLALALALALAGCGGTPGGRTADPAGVDSAPPGATALEVRLGRMTATSARTFLASHPEALVLDVRNPDEWDGPLGHIEGARLLPLPELSARMAELEGWKERPILLVCRSGNRSELAGDLMRAAGYRQLINLEGGMIGWRELDRREP